MLAQHPFDSRLVASYRLAPRLNTRFDQFIWVFSTIWQRNNRQLNTLVRSQLNCPLGRCHTRFITIITEANIASLPFNRFEMIFSHRRASSRYCLRYTRLVAANYIQVPLNHHYEATFTDRLLGLAQRENMTTLII